MKIGELAREAGVSVKAVRYYESIGLLAAPRLGNGYRDFDERDVRVVREIRELAAVGVTAQRARPFVECLVAGNPHGDDCPDAVGAYRDALAELDTQIAELETRRAAISELLECAAPAGVR
ncbi:MAG: MerR family transcriptional regulator [Pseudolysinimonas sp.]